MGIMRTIARRCTGSNSRPEPRACAQSGLRSEDFPRPRHPRYGSKTFAARLVLQHHSMERPGLPKGAIVVATPQQARGPIQDQLRLAAGAEGKVKFAQCGEV